MIVLRSLTIADTKQVKALDKKSGFFVAQWLDYHNCSYGLFRNSTLIGYCTLVYADYVNPIITNHAAYSVNSLLLSDVFICKEYRHRGLGLQMIKEAIVDRQRIDGIESIFLERLYVELSAFYEKAGFDVIDDVCMVKPR